MRTVIQNQEARYRIKPIIIHILTSLLRVFYSLLYHQFAWTYDTVAAIVSVGRWQRWVQTVTPLLNTPLILELGFGPGHLQRAIAEAKLSIVGLDLSPQMCRIARKRLRKKNLPYMFVNGKAQCLPFPSDTFYQVVATFPSEYILESQTLLEVHRVLKLSGQLIVLPMAWIQGNRLTDRFAKLLLSLDGQSYHLPKEGLQPLLNAGFTVKSEYLEIPDSQVLLIRATKTIA